MKEAHKIRGKMNNLFSVDCKKAKAILGDKLSCVIVRDDEVYFSEKSGIAPLMDFIKDGMNFCGFSAADKIVGKAAAMLFCKLGVNEVYAKVISKPGYEYLQAHGKVVHYTTMTEKIINRKGDGICPMESTVLEIDEVEAGYNALAQKLLELRGANK
jgi:hypothetical protein